MRKITCIISAIFIFAFFSISSVAAKTFTDYQSNITFDVPTGWDTRVFDGEPMRAIAVWDLAATEDEIIIIVPQAIQEFQNQAKFYNTRSLINFPDTSVAKLIEGSINDLKEDDASVQILTSKIINSSNNKSYFIMYDNPNKSFRQLMAVTVINGIRYDVWVSFGIPDITRKTERITPLFLDLVRSMRSVY